MELIGKVTKIFPQKTGEGKKGTWTQQDVLIVTNDQYPKTVVVGFFGKKFDPDILIEGNYVKIQIDVKSREYNGKYFTNVEAWGLSRFNMNGNVSSNNSNSTPDVNKADEAGWPAEEQPSNNDTIDSLPF